MIEIISTLSNLIVAITAIYLLLKNRTLKQKNEDLEWWKNHYKQARDYYKESLELSRTSNKISADTSNKIIQSLQQRNERQQKIIKKLIEGEANERQTPRN
ncbi:hypothetical protein [Culicoidibacter larvae]|uniref:Uncharacterized protein n=1 Tax=Culicoidibacter larvae TaxID=2579976 RepID=A0A5R8Q9G5_9FIRM|nr:hypothetical protein [Culicoidibacter larvae]TLG72063.1 hypothetical protein FEZ08_09525 [Culicoidibacter larvae]